MNTHDAVVVNVEQSAGSHGVKGRLESPKADSRTHNGGLLVVGWALGTEHSVTAVELVHGGTVLMRVAVDEPRPDVAGVFPSQPKAGKSGYRTIIPISGLGDTEILVRAELDDGGSAPLGKIGLRAVPASDAEPPKPPLLIRRSAPLGDDPRLWPVPPAELMEYRESSDEHLRDGSTVYEAMRRNCENAGFNLDGALRVLDFGCSNGRITRWFDRPADRQVWGCDIQANQVFWAIENLSPPLRFLINEPTAHLPFKDESLDFVCALSVFSHLKENHIAWLYELVRLVAPHGALYITVHDETAFGQPDVAGLIGRYFAGLERVGDLADVRYVAINDYKAGSLAQVYVSQDYVEQLLPAEFGVRRVFPRGLHTQTAYLITRRSESGPFNGES